MTFAPGNIGFSTFGAPRPMEVLKYIVMLPLFDLSYFFYANYSYVYDIQITQTQIITDDTLGLVSTIWNTRLDEIKDEINIKIDEEKDQPILLMPNFFL